MITCTGCHNTLPDWAQKCQFCGADVTKVSRPAAAPNQKSQPLMKAASWIWPAYYVLACYWIVSGLGGAFDTYHTAVTPVTVKLFGQTDTYTPGFGFWAILGFVISGFTLLVGLGLLARVELARGVANFLAAVKILRGILGLASALMTSLVIGGWGILLSLLFAFDVVAGAMTIYLIGETERNAPNF